MQCVSLSGAGDLGVSDVLRFCRASCAVIINTETRKIVLIGVQAFNKPCFTGKVVLQTDGVSRFVSAMEKVRLWSVVLADRVVSDPPPHPTPKENGAIVGWWYFWNCCLSNQRSVMPWKHQKSHRKPLGGKLLLEAKPVDGL